jgi:DNA-binding MarR family transcriptional regulator
MPGRARLDAPGTLHHVIVRGIERVSIKELRAGGRRRKLRTVRAQIAIGLVETYGVSLAEVARQLYVTTSAVSRIISRANQ